jgi:hypothetical protein
MTYPALVHHAAQRNDKVNSLKGDEMRFFFMAFATALLTYGQWLSYPTPGVPKNTDGSPNLAAPAPRAADGKPDLSGLWEMERATRGTAAPRLPGCEPVNPEFVNIGSHVKGGLPFQPWALALLQSRRGKRIYDPITHCLPIGIIRLHTSPIYRKMIQVPGLLVILNEYNASYRQIITDPNPSWNGYSTGTWDGDVLVVRTNGFRDGLWLDSTGSPLTDAATITERFHRVNFGRLEIEITVDDPKAYTKPWTIQLVQTIKLNTDLLDYICNENEKDLKHMVQ